MKSNSSKLLKWKSLFLISIFSFSLGVSSIAEAKERAGDGSRREERNNRNRDRDKREKNSGDRMKYDGKTSGFGREVGGAIGDKFGGRFGGRIGEKIGDELERKGNQHAHDKWNNRDRRGTSWRVSLLPDDFDELEF